MWREQFLDIMDAIIPWPEWLDISRPYYYDGSAKIHGCRPVGREIVLRMHRLQAWFTLSDESVEDAIYNSYGQRSLILTTNVELSLWGSIFTYKQMAVAMIEQLVHHGH